MSNKLEPRIGESVIYYNQGTEPLCTVVAQYPDPHFVVIEDRNGELIKAKSEIVHRVTLPVTVGQLREAIKYIPDNADLFLSLRKENYLVAKEIFEDPDFVDDPSKDMSIWFGVVIDADQNDAETKGLFVTFGTELMGGR